MNMDNYECSFLSNSFKSSLEECQRPSYHQELTFGPSHRKRHLDNITRVKIDQKRATVKKIEQLLASTPMKYHPYLERAMAHYNSQTLSA